MSKLKKNLQYALESLVDLFYPDFCPGCGRPLLTNEHNICTDCLLDLPYTYFDSSRSNIVTDLLKGRIKSFERGYSLCYFRKQSNLQKMLHSLKYDNKPEIGTELGIYLGKQLKKMNINDFDVIVPVPLHPKKQHLRGYNQSEMIANGIVQIFENKPIDTKSVVRNVYTETQTQKSKFERWNNVKNIFEVKRPKRLENKKILIVDDVLTTGSTIESLSATIEKSVENVEIIITTVAIARKM